MTMFDCPAKFMAMVRQFDNGMLARVQNDGEFSDSFPVTSGFKQGCLLVPILFSIIFSAMLTDAFKYGDNSISIRYRFGGNLFLNLRRLQAKTKLQFLLTWYGKECSNKREGAKKLWIKYLIYLTAMSSQSVSKRLRLCII